MWDSHIYMWDVSPMTVSTENAATPKSTKSRKLNYSVQIQIKVKSQLEFVPRDSERCEVLDLVGFEGVAISVEPVIYAHIYIYIYIYVCEISHTCIYVWIVSHIYICMWHTYIYIYVCSGPVGLFSWMIHVTHICMWDISHICDIWDIYISLIAHIYTCESNISHVYMCWIYMRYLTYMIVSLFSWMIHVTHICMWNLWDISDDINHIWFKSYMSHIYVCEISQISHKSYMI